MRATDITITCCVFVQAFTQYLGACFTTATKSLCLKGRLQVPLSGAGLTGKVRAINLSSQNLLRICLDEIDREVDNEFPVFGKNGL